MTPWRTKRGLWAGRTRQTTHTGGPGPLDPAKGRRGPPDPKRERFSANRWRTEIPSDDPAVQNRLVVPTTEAAPSVVVEKVDPRLHRLLVATTAHRFGDPPRDRRQGGTATTTMTDGPRDGSSRDAEIALMTDRDATIESNPTGVTSNSPGSRIAATSTKKLRVINKSPGASRSPDATRRQRRF